MSLFGTDGIRGKAGEAPLDPDGVLKITRAACLYLSQSKRCVVASDTRVSCGMIKSSVFAGLLSMGVNVDDMGVMPTPAVSIITREKGYDFGIMITASHNPYEDNGLKFFDGRGLKFSDEAQRAIEQLFLDAPSSKVHSIGKLTHVDYTLDYAAYLQTRHCEDAPTVIARSASDAAIHSTDGFKVVVDCANGAACRIAPLIFPEDALIQNNPDGYNINAASDLGARVREQKASLGIAFDGDADRASFVDEKGAPIAGEHILAFLALYLGADKLVTTIVANPALKTFCDARGIEYIAVDVGDKNVWRAMREHDAIVGGEPCGHMLFHGMDCSDGFVTALTLIRALTALPSVGGRHCEERSDAAIHSTERQGGLLRFARNDENAGHCEARRAVAIHSDISTLFTLVPHRQLSLPLENGKLDLEDLKKNLKSACVLRKSGTEKKLRIFLWNESQAELAQDVSTLTSTL